MGIISPLETSEGGNCRDALACDLASLSVSALSKSEKRVAKAMKTPWKARIRILRLLLQVLVQRKQTEEEEEGSSATATTGQRVVEFINTFLPEVRITIVSNLPCPVKFNDLMYCGKTQCEFIEIHYESCSMILVIDFINSLDFSSILRPLAGNLMLYYKSHLHINDKDKSKRHV